KLLGFLTPFYDGSRQEAEVFLKACGGTKEGVLKFAEETRPLYTALGNKMALPLDQFEKEWDQLMTKEGQRNPVFKLLFPARARCGQGGARREANQALWKAAVAVVLDGPAALKTQRDPFGDGPFEYTAFAGGFELRSKLKYQDKPMTLTVGKRPPK